jgi:hypothetical protein
MGEGSQEWLVSVPAGQPRTSRGRGERRYRRAHRTSMHSTRGDTQPACLQTGQAFGAPDRRTSLPERPLPPGLQCTIGVVTCVGSAVVLASARPGALPGEATLVLALSGGPGRFFGRITFWRACDRPSRLRWGNSVTRPPCGARSRPRTGGTRTAYKRRRRDGNGRSVSPHSSPEQPRGSGILPALPSHDGEPRRARGAGGSLRGAGLLARGAPSASGLWRPLRRVPTKGAILGASVAEVRPRRLVVLSIGAVRASAGN